MGTVGTHGINQSLYPKLPYDPVKDFAPITLVAGVPNVLVMNPAKAEALKINTVPDLIRYAKANPGQAEHGLQRQRHVDPSVRRALQDDDRHVSCCTSRIAARGPAVLDLIGGTMDLMFDNLPSSLPQIKAGKLKALAVTSAQRSAALPELPTIAEAAGLKGYEASSWFGLLAPAGTPPDIDQPRAAGDREGVEPACAQGAAAVARRDPERHAQRGVRRDDRRRDEEVGAGREDVGRQGRLRTRMRGCCRYGGGPSCASCGWRASSARHNARASSSDSGIAGCDRLSRLISFTACISSPSCV